MKRLDKVCKASFGANVWKKVDSRQRFRLARRLDKSCCLDGLVLAARDLRLPVTRKLKRGRDDLEELLERK